jgi:hypothetical protein
MSLTVGLLFIGVCIVYAGWSISMAITHSR